MRRIFIKINRPKRLSLIMIVAALLSWAGAADAGPKNCVSSILCPSGGALFGRSALDAFRAKLGVETGPRLPAGYNPMGKDMLGSQAKQVRTAWENMRNVIGPRLLEKARGVQSEEEYAETAAFVRGVEAHMGAVANILQTAAEGRNPNVEFVERPQFADPSKRAQYVPKEGRIEVIAGGGADMAGWLAHETSHFVDRGRAKELAIPRTPFGAQAATLVQTEVIAHTVQSFVGYADEPGIVSPYEAELSGSGGVAGFFGGMTRRLAEHGYGKQFLKNPIFERGKYGSMPQGERIEFLAREAFKALPYYFHP